MVADLARQCGTESPGVRPDRIEDDVPHRYPADDVAMPGRGRRQRLNVRGVFLEKSTSPKTGFATDTCTSIRFSAHSPQTQSNTGASCSGLRAQLAVVMEFNSHAVATGFRSGGPSLSWSCSTDKSRGVSSPVGTHHPRHFSMPPITCAPETTSSGRTDQDQPRRPWRISMPGARIAHRGYPPVRVLDRLAEPALTCLLPCALLAGLACGARLFVVGDVDDALGDIGEALDKDHTTIGEWVGEKRNFADFHQPPESRQHFDVWQSEGCIGEDFSTLLPLFAAGCRSCRSSWRFQQEVPKGLCGDSYEFGLLESLFLPRQVGLLSMSSVAYADAPCSAWLFLGCPSGCVSAWVGRDDQPVTAGVSDRWPLRRHQLLMA